MIPLSACGKRTTVKEAFTEALYQEMLLFKERNNIPDSIYKEDIYPIAYYGEFNGAYVIASSVTGPTGGYSLTWLYTCYFDDLTICFKWPPYILKNGCIYHIYEDEPYSAFSVGENAWEKGILNYKDVIKIKKIEEKEVSYDPYKAVSKLDKLYI